MNENIVKDKRKEYNGFLSKYIHPTIDYLVKKNFSPNYVTLLGFLFSLGAALTIGLGIVRSPLWISWVVQFFLAATGVCDILDGELARKLGRDSKMGAFIDSTFDRLSDAAIIFGLIFGGLISFLHGFIMLFLTVMISYTRARAENAEVDLKRVGLMERSIRLRILILITMVESWIYNYMMFVYGTSFPWFFTISIFVFTCLLIFTLGHRLIYTFKKLKKSEKN